MEKRGNPYHQQAHVPQWITLEQRKRSDARPLSRCREPADSPLTITKCLQCGEEVEVFSTDAAVKCSRYGFVVYNDMESCIQWCRHAKECLGNGVYGKLVRRNV